MKMVTVAEHDVTGQKWKWSQVKLGGAKYSARCGVAATVAPGGRAYTFGGVFDMEDNEEDDDEDADGVFYNDLLCLDIEKQVFRTGRSCFDFPTVLNYSYLLNVFSIER